MLRAPQHRTLQHQVINEIGAEIVSGRWAPGEPLPTEDELARLLGASRNVLREAMTALVAKGLVTVRPKIGTRVRDPIEWNVLDPDVLRWEADHDADAVLRHLTDARAVLEPGMAGMAARRANDADVRELQEAHRLMTAAAAVDDLDAFSDADVAFHLGLVRACHNPLLSSLERALAGALRRGFETTSKAPGRMSKAVVLHRAVVSAVERRDPVAARRAAQRLIDVTSAALVTSGSGDDPLAVGSE